MTEIEVNYIEYRLNKDDSTASVIKVDQAAKEISFPLYIEYESIKYSITSISQKAFQNCKLNKLYIPINIKRLENGWSKSLNFLNFINISSKNQFFIYLDNRLIIGKSNENHLFL